MAMQSGMHRFDGSTGMYTVVFKYLKSDVGIHAEIVYAML